MSMIPRRRARADELKIARDSVNFPVAVTRGVRSAAPAKLLRRRRTSRGLAAARRRFRQGALRSWR